MIIESVKGWTFDLDSNHDNVFMQAYEPAYGIYASMQDFLSLMSPADAVINVLNGDVMRTKTFNQQSDFIDIIVSNEDFLNCKYVIINHEYCYFVMGWQELNSIPENAAYKLNLKYDVWGSNFNAFMEMSKIYYNRLTDNEYLKYSWEHEVNRGTYKIFSEMLSNPVITFTEPVNYEEIPYTERRSSIEYSIKAGDTANPDDWFVIETETAFSVKVLWRRIIVEKNNLSGYVHSSNTPNASYTLGSPWSPAYGDYVVIFEPLIAYTVDTIEPIYFKNIRAIYNESAPAPSTTTAIYNKNYNDFAPVYGENIVDTNVIKMDSTFYLPCDVKTYYNEANDRLVLDTRNINQNYITVGGISSGDFPNVYLYTGISGAPAYKSYIYQASNFITYEGVNLKGVINGTGAEYTPSSIHENNYRNNVYPFYAINPFVHLYIRFGNNTIEFPLLFNKNDFSITVEPKCGATLYKVQFLTGDVQNKSKLVNCIFTYSNGTWAMYTDKMSALIRNEGLFRINGWLNGKIGSASTILNAVGGENVGIGSLVSGIGQSVMNNLDMVATVAHTNLQRDLDSLPASDCNNDTFYQDRFFVYTKEFVPNNYTDSLIHDIHCKGLYGKREVNIFSPNHYRFDYYEGDPYITWKHGILKRSKDSDYIRDIFRKGVTIWYTSTWNNDLDPEEYTYFNKEFVNKER